MDLNQFDERSRDTLERVLSQLQTATLLVSSLENQLFETSTTIQELGGLIETLVSQSEPPMNPTSEG
jgi:hypothetical protein